MSKFVHVQISEELLDLLAGYALNILTGEDLAAVEAHLAGGCELCEKQVAAFQATAVEAIRSGPVWRPPAHIRERLMKLTERTGEDLGIGSTGFTDLENLASGSDFGRDSGRS
jgi:hypothetical protein